VEGSPQCRSDSPGLSSVLSHQASKTFTAQPKHFVQVMNVSGFMSDSPGQPQGIRMMPICLHSHCQSSGRCQRGSMKVSWPNRVSCTHQSMIAVSNIASIDDEFVPEEIQRGSSECSRERKHYGTDSLYRYYQCRLWLSVDEQLVSELHPRSLRWHSACN
jgi:hypothetical protein